MPDAVVLAGGLGTRIRKVLGGLPKVLAEIEGRPFLSHKLDELIENGVSRAHLLTGFGHASVTDFVEDYRKKNSSLEIIEHQDGNRLLGTGGALLKALPHFSERFFLTYGDTLLRLPYSELILVSEATGLPNVLATTTSVGKFDNFNCEVRDSRLIRYDKNGGEGMNSTDYGLMLFSIRALKTTAFELRNSFDLAVVVSRLAARSELAAMETAERYLEIGTPDSLAEARVNFRQR